MGEGVLFLLFVCGPGTHWGPGREDTGPRKPSVSEGTRKREPEDCRGRTRPSALVTLTERSVENGSPGTEAPTETSVGRETGPEVESGTVMMGLSVLRRDGSSLEDLGSGTRPEAGSEDRRDGRGRDTETEVTTPGR